jgi:hypothetical protein
MRENRRSDRMAFYWMGPVAEAPFPKPAPKTRLDRIRAFSEPRRAVSTVRERGDKMDVAQAHEHLTNAEDSIRYFFMVDRKIEVICALLRDAKAAATLKMAISYACVAGIALKHVVAECDEREVVEGEIRAAIAELQYQAAPRPITAKP